MPFIFIRSLFLSLFLGLSVLAAKPIKDLESVLKDLNKNGTRMSAQIVNLTNTREILSVNAEQPLNPASSIKLWVAYAALKKLGINYQFKTEVYEKSSDHSLCIKGGGDPSFVMEDMYLLIEALRRKGIDRAPEKIILDAHAFDDDLYPEGRTDEDSERAYNAPIAALNFNYNTISVYVNPTRKGEKARVGLDFSFPFVEIKGQVMTGGSSSDVTWDKKGSGENEIVSLGGKISENAEEWRKPFRIRNPVKAFGVAFSKMMGAAKTPSITEGTCSGTLIHTYSSRPLSYIVLLMNKYSNNFIADALVKALDHEVNHRSGTTAGGIKVVQELMKEIGVDSTAKGRSFVCGSGLTRENLLSASDFIKLLKHIHKEKLFLPEMFTSLPIAGLDGTLRRKYVHSVVSDRLRGKTGSLNGVQSLVGVYPNSQGEWMGIAILAQGARGIPEDELAKYLNGL